jgi:phosphoribosyl-ATP pyrophosphohydrolase/phosphoribosyl-AMP cyclohydrolase/histidinol dehydrogenase
MPDQSLLASSLQRGKLSSRFTLKHILIDSCGDYASGTNHTLPTNGFARQFSGVNTLSFQKHITSQELTADGLRKLGPTVVTLAEREGLEAHANAVRVRLAALN